MRTIHKYRLDIQDMQMVVMPEGAKVLHVDVQGEPGPLGMRCEGYLCLWAEVDTLAPKVDRMVYITGTGHPIIHVDPEVQHVGSALMFGGQLVWHVYVGPEVAHAAQ